MQEIINNNKAALWYHPKTKIVHHQLRSYIYGQQFRDILERGLELFRLHQACKWLSDDRGNGALDPDDSDWATEVWSPQVIAAGWKFWAIVLPIKVIGQMNMRGWVSMYAEKGVKVEAFTDPDLALSWLEAQ
jgi:hypothetical protein